MFLFQISPSCISSGVVKVEFGNNGERDGVRDKLTFDRQIGIGGLNSDSTQY